jgi:hypothetical protein
MYFLYECHSGTAIFITLEQPSNVEVIEFSSLSVFKAAASVGLHVD